MKEALPHRLGGKPPTYLTKMDAPSLLYTCSVALRLGGKPHRYVGGTDSRSSSPVKTGRLSAGVHMVLPIIAEPLSPRDRQSVAGAVEDGVTEHGDPPVHGWVSLRKPANVDRERHEVTDHLVALLGVLVSRCCDGSRHQRPHIGLHDHGEHVGAG